MANFNYQHPSVKFRVKAETYKRECATLAEAQLRAVEYGGECDVEYYDARVCRWRGVYEYRYNGGEI